jgi:hypothetical protein
VEGGLSGRSERSTRLRGASEWQQRNMAMEDLRRGKGEENMEDGSKDVLRAPADLPSGSSSPRRRVRPKQLVIGQMQH